MSIAIFKDVDVVVDVVTAVGVLGVVAVGGSSLGISGRVERERAATACRQLGTKALLVHNDSSSTASAIVGLGRILALESSNSSRQGG